MVNGSADKKPRGKRRSPNARKRYPASVKTRTVTKMSIGVQSRNSGYTIAQIRSCAQRLFNTHGAKWWQGVTKEKKEKRIAQAVQYLRDTGIKPMRPDAPGNSPARTTPAPQPKTVQQPVRTVVVHVKDPEAYPPTWEPQQGNFHMAMVAPGSEEWNHVAKHFYTGDMSEYKLVRVNRVQNKYQWDKYCAEKRGQFQLYGPRATREKFLWHGSSNTIPEILASGAGVDPKHAGKGFYDRGAYFAANPAYSDESYAHRTMMGGKEVRQLLLCTVLVGKSMDYGTNTARNLIKPPAGHQSVCGGPHKVNSRCKHATRMWVVYATDQSKVDYVVTYARK